jgi:uncharacterized membrane protein YfcA
LFIQHRAQGDGVTLLLIAPAVLLTSMLSGIFGMGGGMLLMGVYASLLPVAAAIVLHGVTQLVANGYRAYMLRDRIYWPALVHYGMGAVVATIGMAVLAVRADRMTLFLVLGGVPLVVSVVPQRWVSWSIERRGPAIACGVVCTAAQLVAGVSGALLDLFFVRGSLDRFQVIGTKGVVQCAGHAIKIVYFLTLFPLDASAPAWTYPVCVVFAVAGTRLGARVLERLSDAGFRRYSAALIAAVSLLFVGRGLLGSW